MVCDRFNIRLLTTPTYAAIKMWVWIPYNVYPGDYVQYVVIVQVGFDCLTC
jgi:hypothetical protein